jgi:hypothetical protein
MEGTRGHSQVVAEVQVVLVALAAMKTRAMEFVQRVMVGLA